MKKFFACIVLAICIGASSPAAFAASAPLSNAPYLNDISFSNAVIDGGFSQSKTHFSITLQDPAESAMLKSYSVNGSANVFVTYDYDSSNHQKGIIVTLSFESGTVIYTFDYSNLPAYEINSNANLKSVSCELGEVQPEINDSNTVYKLYLPKDLTDIKITPVTADINAYCAPLSMETSVNQEFEHQFTVTASDGTTKKYIFKIKRVDKTAEEVRAEMASPDFNSFVDGELFYQKPAFIITFGAVAGGAAVIIIIALISRRIMVNPYDPEEAEFYTSAE